MGISNFETVVARVPISWGITNPKDFYVTAKELKYVWTLEEFIKNIYNIVDEIDQVYNYKTFIVDKSNNKVMLGVL